ncbi:MAG: hypothetical protein SGJ18_03505 [Pseudomonadota bacterium]|nr:hypothetical protein [Pseudomonadota bacterium]
MKHFILFTLILLVTGACAKKNKSTSPEVTLASSLMGSKWCQTLDPVRGSNSTYISAYTFFPDMTSEVKGVSIYRSSDSQPSVYKTVSSSWSLNGSYLRFYDLSQNLIEGTAVIRTREVYGRNTTNLEIQGDKLLIFNVCWESILNAK